MKKGRDITVFQGKVYDVVRFIPLGRVSTYKIIAGRINCGSSRAVGQALKRNPYAPEVPCHRVISSDLSIGGFQGHKFGSAVRKKKDLLRKEGVLFKNGKLVDVGKVFSF